MTGLRLTIGTYFTYSFIMTYLSRDFESETGVTDESGFCLLETSLLAEEDGVLFLVSSLVLFLEDRQQQARGTGQIRNEKEKGEKSKIKCAQLKQMG